jgi:exodeoxyribonuclease-3
MSTRIFTWNVNGIRACHKKGMMDWLQKESPDILCIQETKARKEQVPPDAQAPEGYHAYWHSAQRPGYSGVLCYSKKKPKEVILGIGDEQFDVEGRCIQLIYNNFALINSYVPNGSRDLHRVPYKLDYYDALLKRSHTLQKQGLSVIMTGDWNTCHQEIDLARPKANKKSTGFLAEEREWIDKFIDAGHVDTFREEFPELEGAYSWWSNRAGAREKNVGWRLDYYLVDQKSSKRCLGNKIHPDVLGSDHCPVELIWK